ncbi:MAG: MATE family efflux transporter [Firmicutes bacterium]|nr:MATE family efflux transporter [Bacillota bacterium]
MIKDLTCGSPRKVLLQFSLPMLVSVIFQQLYNIADSVIAGRCIGEDALSAVGVSYPITMIFMAIAIGSNIGTSVVISQLFGAKQYSKMKTAVYTAVISSLVLAVILTVVGLVITNPLMRLIQTPDNIFADSALYLKIYIGGFVFLFLYNIATGIFQSLGDSKTPLYFLICSSVGNIVLDILFVTAFDMGVAGLAWATFAAQGAACVLAVIALFLRLKTIDAKGRAFSAPMLKRIALIAVPSILQQSFVSVGNIFIQGIINGFGSSVIAGYSAAVKLNTFVITSLTTLGNASSSFTAQNVGAKKYNRIREGYKDALIISLCIAALFFIAFFAFSPQFIRLFVEGGGDAAQTGIEFLRIVSPFYFVITVKLVTDGVLRGSSAMGMFMVSTFTDLVLRVALCFILSPVFGRMGVWMSWPIGWTIAAVLSVAFYIRLYKNKSEEEN